LRGYLRDQSTQRGGAPRKYLQVYALTVEPALKVTKVGEVGTDVGPSGLASLSLITALGSQEASFGLSLLLWRGDNEVALRHGDFLQC